MLFNKISSFSIVTNRLLLKLKFGKNLQQYKQNINFKQDFSKMPRDKVEVQALKEIRMKRKKQCKSARFPPGEIYLCVLGNGSISSPRALYVFTDHDRYLFNCGEGTQRLSTEYKTKLSKLDNIFITHKTWDNLGGLLGLSLTLQDIGVPELSLHGPCDIGSLFNDSKSFVFLKSLNIVTKDLSDGKFSDDCMDVYYIPIYSEDPPSKSSVDSSDSSCQESEDDMQEAKEPRLKKLCVSPKKKKNKDMVVAYGCKGHRKLGQLLYEKCIELGVPPGPLLGDLKNGKDVTLASGRIVRSKDVVSESQDCPVFLVVECPSQDFLLPFVTEKQFCEYQTSSSSSSETASLVVHFTPPEILHSQEYQDWMNKFPESTCHLILNEDNATLNSANVHRVQHKLNLLHPGIFSLLHENEVVQPSIKNQKQNIVQANTLERFYLRPAKGMDRSFGLKISSDEFVEKTLQIEGFKESLDNFKSSIQHHPINGDQFPIITFLGTGSSIPSKARNVSSILINTSEKKYILLDCGEGTHGQLVRLYGKNHQKVLEQLNCVFISHMHADHHLGLIKILQSREKLFRSMQMEYKQLLVIGPNQLNWWLKNYHKHIEHITYLYRFIECSVLDYTLLLKLAQNDIDFSQNIQLATVPVHHCLNAYGIVIASKDSKWKIVYSGDTMPCDKLVDAGQNCTVLIHEATMEDDLLDEAVLKRHSTTSQAIKIGEDMKSKYTILTHFSQRYAKIPLFNENFHNFVGCAFDNMTIRSDELYILPLLIPTLKCLFAEDVEDMTTRGDRRRKKMELFNEIVNESVLNKV